MLKAILFDLDGTLLHLDLDVFLAKYLQRVSTSFADVLPSGQFTKALMDSTESMIRDTDSGKSNRDVFVADFSSRLGRDVNELMPRFDRFYQEEFPLLQDVVSQNPAALRVIKLAQRNGLDIVVATNPVFPKEAIRKRLEWANLADVDFKLITTYEVMHFCKPNPAYFTEVLTMIEREPHECLMVGNDVEEDIVAGKLGIKTYLATDCLIDRGSGLKADFAGPFAQLEDVLVKHFGLKA